MANNALIFDCDGVLSDTERDGHRPAFNLVFAEAGLPVRWSVEDYAEAVKIGGGKERMSALLTDKNVADWGLPTDPAEQKEMIANWHKAKTAHYKDLIKSGALPPRPGIARIAAEADRAGWKLAVASTSAEESVRAVLEHAVGPELAAKFAVYAGDAVPAKKPAPDIYLLALRELGVEPWDAVVVEDSNNGLRAALAAGLATVVTRSSYTTDEDFTDAGLVVDDLGDGDHRVVVVDNPLGLDLEDEVHLADLDIMRAAWQQERGYGAAQASDPDGPTGVARMERIVHDMATGCVENEKYFNELDAGLGDGDTGESLARGFEIALNQWYDLDRTDVGKFLLAVGKAMGTRMGGTSGAIWPGSFKKMGRVVRGKSELTGADVVEMLRTAIAGITALPGGATVGEKTLIDALVPMTDEVEAALAEGADARTIARRAAVTARAAAEKTSELMARKGRAASIGERSIGRPDPGAMAVAVLAERVADNW